jgi:type VI secretion system protein ImpL
MLHTLTTHWLYWLSGSVFLLGMVVFMGVRIVRNGRQASHPPPSADTLRPGRKELAPDGQQAPAVPVSHVFSKALHRLRNCVTRKTSRYDVPWYLLIGEPQSGKTTLLSHTGLDLRFGPPSSPGFGTSTHLDWWLFDQGIILDTDGTCVAGENGTPPDRERWDRILRALVRHRPQRPIDGMIVTIPASSLYGKSLERPDHRKALQAQAGHLFQALSQAQKFLGLNVPVYLLVTKCDAIPGFQAFTRMLPHSRTHEMVGWSNPHSVDMAYSPGWMPAAFRQIRQNLHATQLELLSEIEAGAPADLMFIVPDMILSMEAATTFLLNQIFKESVYHETFFLRGLYFSGDATPPSDRDPAVPGTGIPERAVHVPAEANREIVFLRDLFQRRIFPERGVGRPVKQGVLYKNRIIVAAQCLILTVIVGGGWALWNAYESIATTNNVLYPMLSGIRDDVSNEKSTGMKNLPAPVMKMSTEGLLELMNRLDVSPFKWALVPTTWVSPLRARITQAMTIAYNRIIFQSVSSRLQQKVQEVLNGPSISPGAAENMRADTPAEETPEFLSWSRYVSDVTDLEEAIERFNGLQAAGQGKLEEFGRVVDYVYPQTLTKEFYRHPVYQNALDNAGLRTIEFTPSDREKATGRLWEYSLNLFTRLFDNNHTSLVLKELVAHLHAIDETRRVGRPAVEQLQTLQNAFEAAEAVLHSAEGKWLAQERMNLGKDFHRALEQAAKSNLFDSTVFEHIQHHGEQKFQQVQSDVLALEVHREFPLLNRSDQQPEWEFSKQTRHLQAVLSQALQLRFVEAGPEASGQISGPSTLRVIWHPEILNQGIELWDDYQRFLNNEMPRMPRSVAGPFQQIVRHELSRHWDTMVKQARERVVSPGMAIDRQLEERLRLEVHSFKQARSALEQTLRLFKEGGFEDAYWELHEFLTAQAHDLLTRVDLLMESGKLYEVQGGTLVWWEGDTPLASRAYDVHTRLGLQTYLESQRDRIGYLAHEYANPLVGFLVGVTMPQAQSGAQRLLISKWQGILAALEDYEQKKPGNSVMKLEGFIGKDMNELTGSTCVHAFPHIQKTGLTDDFFGETNAELVRLVQHQCHNLIGQHFDQGYAELQRFFNRHVAGQFPFAPDERSDRTISPKDVERFFRLFDRYFPPGSVSSLPGKVLGPERTPAQDFIRHMTAVRKFFAPFLDGEKPDRLPAYQLDVQFRVNRSHERGGNQVIDWVFAVGTTQVAPKPGELSSKIRWGYGDPITLSLRWAKDAPWQPVTDPQQPHIHVQDHVVTFAYQDPWSLVTFLMTQAAAPGDFDSHDDPRPHTLKFRLPTMGEEATSSPVSSRKGEAAVDRPEPQEATIFVRVVLTSPGHEEEFVVPWFPRHAPSLPHLVAERSSNP